MRSLLLSLLPIAFSQDSNFLGSTMPTAPADSILDLQITYKDDPSPDKVDLSVGVYRTPQNQPYLLPAVETARNELLSDPTYRHLYVPIEGTPEFRAAAQRIMFGPSNIPTHIATVQSLSGTGALRLGFALFKKFGTGASQPSELGAGHILIPDPTWPNHHNIARDAQLPKTLYQWEVKDGAVNHAKIVQAVHEAPAGSAVLLHLCAHNPVGVDLSEAQWGDVFDAIEERGLLPFFDNAYQGFASGDAKRDSAPVLNSVEVCAA